MKLTDNYGFYVPSVEDEENVVDTLAGNFQAIDSILTAHNIFLEETTQEQMRAIERISTNNTDLINDFKEEINRITKETKDTAAAARRISETVQSQFHQIIQEVGTNNPEIVQARGGKANLNERLNEFSEQLADNSRQTVTLSQGTSVVSGGKSTSLVDVEIEGRTLVPLGNSVLEPGKKYVVADRKTRVIVDGQTVNGVGRFTKIGNAERVKIVRVANFEGKIAGSNVESPHRALFKHSPTLDSPTTFSNENQSFYDRLVKLDNFIYSPSTTVSGQMAQKLFSFNLIEEIERNIGKIPRGTVAEKVAWVKANVSRLGAKYHGFGSSVGGNKATLSFWDSNANSWNGNFVLPKSHTSSNSSILEFNVGLSVTRIIDNNGYSHLLANAEPSDGTTPSVINTDYVELEIELKETADFTNPRVPLYEVTDAEYLKILTEWNADEVARRFPMVQGVQHLQGVGIVAEGENLLPPFSEWNLHPTSKINSSSELEQNPTATSQLNTVEINVSQNQAYNFSCIRKNADSLVKVTYLDDKKTNIGAVWLPFSSNSTFTTPTGTKILRVDIYPNVTNQVGWSSLMLTLGTTPKPFVPRNPSSLYADVKLGAIGGKFDRLYASNGRWFVRKEIEKDVVLDGSFAWLYSHAESVTGYKRAMVEISEIGNNAIVLDNKGGRLEGSYATDVRLVIADKFMVHTGVTPKRLYLGLSNSNTGFTDSHSPSNGDIRRYFNGWKYVDGTTWTSVTGNGQTATGQQALDTKPSDYTPYKLSYVLATPQTIDVTDKVEAAIKLNGLTQISVDAGFRRNFKDGKSDWKKGSTMDYTANPVNVKMTYANNVRNALDETTTRLQDNTVKLDQHERAIVDLYAQLKAMGVK